MGGKTQQNISDRGGSKGNVKRYKYSFDAKSFDLSLSPFPMALYFYCIIEIFAANLFTKTRIKQLMQYELTAGYYHKFLGLIQSRIGGLLSGSGLTNQIGTFCTLFMCITILLNMGYTVTQISQKFDFMVTGDDLVIFSDDVLLHHKFIEDALDLFGIEYKLDEDLIGTPTNDSYEFAGSH